MLKFAKIAAVLALALPAAQPAPIVPEIQLPAQIWQTPLEAPIQLINQYRQPNSDYSAGHRGVDYRVSLGDPLLSPANGRVWFAGKVVNRRVLSIMTADGMLAEFEPACSSLSQGALVNSGQVIGWVCDADASYLQHCPEMRCLHFSLRISGRYLSPLFPIGQLNPSRLLAQKP